MEITFRPPHTNDVDGMLRVEQQCFEPGEQMSKADFVNIINQIPKTIIIADVDGQVAGMIIGRTTANRLLDNASYSENLKPQPNDQYLGILGLAVSPDYQGQGIAGQLLDRAEALAAQLKLSGLILDCRERLIPFYQKHAFELLGRSNSTFGGIEWFGMQKNLTK